MLPAEGTWFIYTDFQIDSPMLLARCQIIKYHCRGYEICPSSGRPHWQGAINTRQSLTPSQLRSYIGWQDGRGWLDYSKAYTSAECVAYCKKGGRWVEDGAFVEERLFRRDVTSAIQIAKTEEIKESFFNESDISDKPFDRPKEVIFLRGSTSENRMRFIANRENIDKVFVFNDFKKGWWDGYMNHRVIIKDVFPGVWKKGASIHHLLDRYPTKVPIRYGFKNFVAERIYITSNYSFESLGEPWLRDLRFINYKLLLNDDMTITQEA